MKKLSIILSLLLCYVFCFGQSIVNRSNNTITVSDARLQAGLNMFLPRAADTVAYNLQKGIDSCGAMFFGYDINGYWYRGCSPKRWIQIATGTGTNIYNSDGRLTGNRILSGSNNYNLLLDSLTSFGVNAQTGNILFQSDGNLEGVSANGSITFTASTGAATIQNSQSFISVNSTGDAILSAPFDSVRILHNNSTASIGAYKLLAISPTGGLTTFTGTISGGGGGIHSVNSTNPFGMVQINDSTTRTDSFLFATRAWRQKGIDSVAGLIPAQFNSIAGYGISITGTYPNKTFLADTTLGAGLIGWPRYLKFKDSVNAVFTPMARTLTINGTTQDLSANRTFTVSGVAPTGGDTRLFLIKNSGTDYDYSWANTIDSIRYLNTASFKLPTSVWGFGNSNSTTTLVAQDSLHYYRFAASSGITSVANHAFPGRATFANIENHNATIQPGHSTLTIVEMSYNDPRRSGNDRKMLNQTANAHAAMIVNQLLASYTLAGSANVSLLRFGGTTGYAPNIVGGKGNNGWSTTTTGDSIAYTFTSQTNVVWTGIGGDSTNQAFARYIYRLYDVTASTMVTSGTYTENSQWSGISDGTNNNQRGPVCDYFTGLNSTHTYKLSIVSNQSTNLLAIDYFGHLQDPSTSVPIIIAGPAHMTAAGYATAPANASDAVMDTFNVHIDSTVTAFKTRMGSNYPVFFFNPNSSTWGANQFNPATDMGGDGIHYNDQGQRKHYLIEKTLVPTIQNQLRDGSTSFDGIHWYGWRSGVAYQFDGGGSGSSVVAGWGNYDSASTIGNYFQKGLAGGNTLTFGTGAADNGIIRTTSAASPTGKLYFKSTSSSYYDPEFDRWSFGGNTGQPAAVTITGNNALTTHAVLYVKGQVSQTGDLIGGYNSGGTKLFQLQASGAIGIGLGDWAGSYPGQGAYFFVNGGINFERNYNNSAWVPKIAEASTWTWKAGSATTFMNANSSGRLFVGGSTSATALVHLAAGTATASTSPLKFTSGTNLTAAEAGAVEWNGTQLFLTSSTPTRNIVAQVSGSTALTSGTTPVATTDGRLTDGLILAQGTYTPTLTSVSNVASSSPSTFQYIRVGNEVSISGVLNVTPSVITTLTQIAFSLPIASNFTSSADLSGSGTTVGATYDAVFNVADATNDRGQIEFMASSIGAQNVWVTFHYTIK